jgi:hypothetical protein
LKSGTDSSLSSVPPVCPRPRPDIIGTCYGYNSHYVLSLSHYGLSLSHYGLVVIPFLYASSCERWRENYADFIAHPPVLCLSPSGHPVGQVNFSPLSHMPRVSVAASVSISSPRI